jgi:hypothetical protein
VLLWSPCGCVSDSRSILYPVLYHLHGTPRPGPILWIFLNVLSQSVTTSTLFRSSVPPLFSISLLNVSLIWLDMIAIHFSCLLRVWRRQLGFANGTENESRGPGCESIIMEWGALDVSDKTHHYVGQRGQYIYWQEDKARQYQLLSDNLGL